MLIHPAPLAILKRHMQASKDRLFPELTPGGLDKKPSSSAAKAYGRYRRACGVPDGTDFHSFRRNAKLLEFEPELTPAAAVMIAIEAFDKSSDVDPAEAAEIYVDGTAAKDFDTVCKAESSR